VSTTLAQLQKEFAVGPRQLATIAADFRDAMAAGLAGRPSPLKMLPSYLGRPTGRESGQYLALDFGGSNVRVQLVELHGDGRWTVRRQTAAPLKDPAGGYDYTAVDASAGGLFDFIAGQIAQTVDKDDDLRLGHTFSFPCRQLDVGRAELLSWTKEIRTAGVEGREVNALLADALVRRGLGRIRPCAILNDTVGTLLAAAYADPAADIAAICGTGHNTCYYDVARAMIINMESGNFDRLPFTAYDQAVDAASEKPSVQRLEKMAAGRYLGEMARLAADDLGQPAAADLTAEGVAAWLTEPAAPAELHSLAGLIVTRAARLVAATFLGVLTHTDPALAQKHTIAIDGSLYEKLPGYAEALKIALADHLGAAADRLDLRLVKDGSGVGAAIAAAIAGSGCR
jgi:hexokinase